MKQKLFRGKSLCLTFLLMVTFSFAQVVPDYYTGINLSDTGETLKNNLSVLITSTQTVNLSYTPGVWDALQQTDLDPTNNNNVLLLYGYDDSDNNYVTDRTRSKDLNGGNQGDWNREHTYPRSLGNPNLGSTGPGSDAHHLRSTDVSMNSNRGNLPFGDGVGNAGNVSGSWYPGDEWKGDVARMMMYMYLRYGTQCLPAVVGTGTQNYHPDMMDIFLEWNAEDPVSTYEINRNVLLEGIQGNRNPFIDNPAFATAIWGGPQAEDRFNGSVIVDTEFPTAVTAIVASDITNNSITLTWNASTDNIGVIAYQIYQDTNIVGSVTGTNYTVSSLVANTNYTFEVVAVDAAGNSSENNETIAVTTLDEVVTPPVTGDAIVFQGFENTTNDTWGYQSNPVLCNDGGNDVWDIVTTVGSITAANTGTSFFGIRDLEGNCGTAEGGSLVFDSVDVSTYEDVVVSFSLQVVGYDVSNGDELSYEVFNDGISQGVVVVTDVSPYSTDGWVTVSEAIPNTVNNVAITINAKQNGASDYAGIDDVKLTGTEIVSTPASIIINEVDADTEGTDTLEFVELYDGGIGNTSLDGLVLVFYNGANDTSYATYDLTGQTTSSAGYFVIGNPDVPNVSSMTFASNGLQNGADAVALYTGNAADFNNTTVTTEGLIDAFVYDTNDADATGLLPLLNAGQEQINEDAAGDKDFHSSQRIPNGTGELRNTSSYKQLTPTPGEENKLAVVLPSIIINEVDADTEGTDTLEFVELYDGGAGNTSLDGFVLVFYNGSNDTSYAAYDLTGQTTNNAGYFVIGNVGVPNVSSMTFASNGLQNGADAVALYTGNVTDFENTTVTTEGLIDAFVYGTNDADATGLLPLLNEGELQVNEDGADDKDFHSSQRIPNGSGGLRNTSSYLQITPTPGEENKLAVTLPAIMINELDADTAGTDTLEFVELYDGGVGNTSLDGFVLVFYNGSNDTSYAVYDLSGQTTNNAGYFVIGNVDVPNVSSMTFASNGLQNGADAVALYAGNASDFNNSIVTTEGLIDAVVYDTNDADDTGLLVLLNEGQVQVNEDDAGDKDAHSLQRFENGSGALRNTDTYIQAIPTPGTANTNLTVKVDLVINEVDADTEGTDTLEFVELYDGGVGNSPLDGFVVVMYNGSNDTAYGVYDLTGYVTNEEGYFVLGNIDVPNVGLVFASNGLQNGVDAVALYRGAIANYSVGTVVTTDGLEDALVYDTNDGDDEGLLILLNEGQLQLNEDELGDKDRHSLQRIPNGEGGLRNTLTYVQDDPTPGTENGAIEPVPDPITIQEARNTVIDELITVTGVLTVSDQFGGTAFIQDETAGIAIFDELVHGDGNFAIGDVVTVTGVRSVFNEQIQISPVTAVTYVDSVNSIIPTTISINELSDYTGQLVRIENPVFENVGDLIFANSNHILSDTTANAMLRVDADVNSLVGMAIPSACSEVIGVVGKFYETYQILPRTQEDFACATDYTPVDTVQIDKEKVLDVVTWNIEWFGDDTNAPTAGAIDGDLIQKDSVKQVIASLNADIYAVQEIADVDLFTQMVTELPAYDFILSEATSYPNGDGVKQQLGYIYKKETVSIIEAKPLLTSVHPYYNGGDESALSDYPIADKTRFFASGRLPFLLKANVTIEGSTEEINLVNLHARANGSSDSQERYDMRKYDVEALKDTLDTYYADKKLILLGDYNDDVDVTVATGVSSTLSTFDAYVNDTDNYQIVSASLSDRGYQSYVFRENMIDHITLSDEFTTTYIVNSEQVHYEFYDSDYATTASDHFPVSVQVQLQALAIDEVVVTDEVCLGNGDGAVLVTTSGGTPPYEYQLNEGAFSTDNLFEGLSAGTYSLNVRDSLGNTVSQDVVINEGIVLRATITENTTVYNGYESASCASLFVESVEGGVAPYTYQWSTGDTTDSIEVCPTEVGEVNYSVLITDANGCTIEVYTTVEVIDVSCEKRGRRRSAKEGVQMCHNNKRSVCVDATKVDRFLENGYTLGYCGDYEEKLRITNLDVYPNRFRNTLQVDFESNYDTDVTLAIYNYRGRKVYETSVAVTNGVSENTLQLSQLHKGFYYLKVMVNNKSLKIRSLLKY